MNKYIYISYSILAILQLYNYIIVVFHLSQLSIVWPHLFTASPGLGALAARGGLRALRASGVKARSGPARSSQRCGEYAGNMWNDVEINMCKPPITSMVLWRASKN